MFDVEEQLEEIRSRLVGISEELADLGISVLQEALDADGGNAKRPELETPCDRCGRTDKKLVFDHCHETLAHRGWLCDNCNRSMGMLGDDVEGMLLSAIYIAKTTNIDSKTVIGKLKELWK